MAFLTTEPAAAANGIKATNFLLENGMEVVVIPDHRAPIVKHMLWYKVGSADEPPGKSGIAHFFEHLMFKETADHGAGELDRAVAEIGGSLNAFTSYDYTAFYEIVPPSALEQMMSYEADRMRNLTLTDDVIDAERDVVREERRLRVDNNPQALLDEEVVTTLWQSQPYRIPVIGWMHEIEKLNRSDAITFYYKHYWPNNAVLVVAGDVEPESVRALAERIYGKLPRGPELPTRERASEPVQNTKRVLTLSDDRVLVPLFSRHWVVPSYRTAEPGEAEALDLLAEILGGGNRSRLYQELVVEQGIAAAAYADFQGNMLDAGKFSIRGWPRGDAELADVEAAVDAEIARIASNGVTNDELEQTKNRYIRSFIFGHDEQGTVARLYGATLATGGNVKDVEEWPDRIRKVTADQVKAVAARYLVSDHSTTGYLLPKEN
ncbi:pitrilysin family protein [Mesorhizobium ciceri]|uniref:M16 family metallopeptidase n=1 Tax=Mesorhizobium TaxID=68287 RepID=UPI0007A951F2|nr:pitrilysin family protein [Mesorhizobium ciceri]AMX98950.1 zinc protease [Mesorhizobium ciceri biovar biserrulae]